jgi:hypothetical protein
MKYHFTYQTKCLVNGKTYIGVHSTNKINDGYIGCGILSPSTIKSQIKANRTSPILNAINKYGYNNFKLEILSFFDSKEEAYEDEAYIVNEEWVKSKDNYNVKVGGIGGTTLPNLISFKDDIIKMYLDGAQYKEICNKYNVTKGSFISFIKPYIRKRKKKSFYFGMEFENAYGDIVVFSDPESFYERTWVTTKTLHKIKSKGQDVAYGNVAWFIRGSKSLEDYKSNFFSNKQHWKLTREEHDEKRFISAVRNRSKK